MRKKVYVVLSPDNITTQRDTTYKTIKQARAERKRFAARYKGQGYYSGVRNGQRIRIAIEDIEFYCTICATSKKIN